MTTGFTCTSSAESQIEMDRLGLSSVDIRIRVPVVFIKGGMDQAAFSGYEFNLCFPGVRSGNDNWKLVR